MVDISKKFLNVAFEYPNRPGMIMADLVGKASKPIQRSVRAPA